MASAEAYGRWIVENSDKKGTPDFEAVAAAYKAARAQEDGETAQSQRNQTIGAQTGLTARGMVKGVIALPAIGADAIGGVANAGLDLVGAPRGFRFQQTLPTIDSLMTQGGLPTPANAAERNVQQAVEMGTGAGAGAVGFGFAAARAAPGAIKTALGRLSAAPATQVVGGAAGGYAGSQAKESGAGFWGQLVSTVVGGLLGGGAFGATAALGRDAASRVGQMLRPQITQKVIDQQITIALQQSGIDPSSINPAIMASLSEDVAKAMQKPGNLSPGAVSRLADYRITGTTPTTGRLSLDPYQITQEANTAKRAAAMGVRSAQLPQIANENNAKLISMIDDFKPLSDRLAVGERAASPILSADAAKQAGVKSLNDQAKAMAGGDIPLQRGQFIEGIFKALDDESLTAFADPRVMSFLKQIATDPNIPFTVRTVDNLRRIVSGAYSPTANGNDKAALKAIAKAIDAADMAPDTRMFGGNQVVTGSTAQTMQNADAAPTAIKGVLDQARAAHASRMRWQESSPIIEGLVQDGDPARLVEQIVSRTTSAKQVAPVANAIKADPAALEAARSGIAQYLKDAAIGRGNESATGNFSGRQLAAALDNIGDSKLGLFFDRAEIDKLRAMARVGINEAFQPKGSAVNNSNTGAEVASFVAGLSKYIRPVAMAASPLVSPVRVGLMEIGTRDVPKGLLTPSIQNGRVTDPVMLPALLGMGGLLSP